MIAKLTKSTVALLTGMCVLIVFTASPAAAFNLCKEPIGDYYVNISIKNDGFAGNGFDDVFPVEIVRVKPKNQEEVQILQQFGYFSGTDADGKPFPDGRSYEWKRESQGHFQLYKRVPGRKSQKVDVMAAVFPRTKEMTNHMRLKKANSRYYSSFDLKNRLKYMGVMGLAYSGREAKVDFINNLDLSQSGEVVVSNADVMLYRHALAMSAFENTDTIVTQDDRNQSVNLYFKALMKKDDEQSALDGLMQLEDFTKVFDKASKIGSVTIPELDKNSISIRYLPCIPYSGEEGAGGAKAVFYPVKITDDGNKWAYPLFVYPTALTSPKSIKAAIERSLYQARWWLAAGNLEKSTTSESGFLREAVMRYSPAYFEELIFNETKSTDKGDESTLVLLASHREQLGRAIQRITASVDNTKYSLPWTSDINALSPQRNNQDSENMLHGLSENGYNRILSGYASTLGDVLKNTGTGGAKKEKTIHDLIGSMTTGYHMTADGRTDRLNTALNDMNYVGGLTSVMEYLPGFRTENNKSLVLISNIQSKGYAFNDFEWLNQLAKSGKPLSDLENDRFGKRLKYLVQEKNTATIEGLSIAWGEPFYLSADDDPALVAGAIADLKKKIESLAGDESRLKDIARTKSLQELKVAISDIRGLKAELQEAQVESAQISLDAKTISQDIRKNKKELARVVAGLEESSADREAIQRYQADTEQAIQTTETEITETTKQLQAAETKRDALKRESEQARSEIARTEAELEETENKKLLYKTAEAAAQLSEQQVQENLAQLRKLLRDKLDALEIAKSAYDVLQKALAEKKTEVAATTENETDDGNLNVNNARADTSVQTRFDEFFVAISNLNNYFEQLNRSVFKPDEANRIRLNAVETIKREGTRLVIHEAAKGVVGSIAAGLPGTGYVTSRIIGRIGIPTPDKAELAKALTVAGYTYVLNDMERQDLVGKLDGVLNDFARKKVINDFVDGLSKASKKVQKENINALDAYVDDTKGLRVLWSPCPGTPVPPPPDAKMCAAKPSLNLPWSEYYTQSIQELNDRFCYPAQNIILKFHEAASERKNAVCKKLGDASEECVEYRNLFEQIKAETAHITLESGNCTRAAEKFIELRDKHKLKKTRLTLEQANIEVQGTDAGLKVKALQEEFDEITKKITLSSTVKKMRNRSSQFEKRANDLRTKLAALRKKGDKLRQDEARYAINAELLEKQQVSLGERRKKLIFEQATQEQSQTGVGSAEAELEDQRKEMERALADYEIGVRYINARKRDVQKNIRHYIEEMKGIRQGSPSVPFASEEWIALAFADYFLLNDKSDEEAYSDFVKKLKALDKYIPGQIRFSTAAQIAQQGGGK